MRRIFLLTRRRRAGAPAPPLPSNLVFAGYVANYRAAGKLWQDAAKTIPAVADGDPVRVMVDPNTGQEAVAPSDPARPLLWQDVNNWSLSFDGIDDQLLVGNTTTWVNLAHGVFARVTFNGFNPYMTVASTQQAVGGWRAYGQLAAQPWGTFGGGDQHANTTLVPFSFYTLGWNGGNYRLNAAPDGTYPGSQGTVDNGGKIQIGNDGDPSRFLNGRMAAIVVCSQPVSGTQLAALETYLGSLL
jgi:hypothetical protein